jgi:hypothetical protein
VCVPTTGMNPRHQCLQQIRLDADLHDRFKSFFSRFDLDF